MERSVKPQATYRGAWIFFSISLMAIFGTSQHIDKKTKLSTSVPRQTRQGSDYKVHPPFTNDSLIWDGHNDQGKNVAYQSYLSHHYLPHGNKRPLMLKLVPMW